MALKKHFCYLLSTDMSEGHTQSVAKAVLILNRKSCIGDTTEGGREREGVCGSS